MEEILSEGFGLTGNVFKIECNHHSFAPMPNPNEPPITILIHFLLLLAQAKVLQVAKEQLKIEWEDCELSFFENLTRELAFKGRNSSP